jgi:serine/threonine-protein kinase
MTITSKELVGALRETTILSPNQLEECDRLIRYQETDARLFAKLLVQRGWLTVFQMNQLLAGRGKELQFGYYQITDKLGQGGLSQVYKAWHTETGMTVALKVIKPEVLANSEGQQQFLKEMEAMALLDHPNIVQFCDADQAGDTFFFAMEYIEGTDLGKMVRLTGPLPVADACDYIRQTALGLQHAHERNLVHRDIKPVNLFLTQPVKVDKAGDGQAQVSTKPKRLVKILDWGLAGLRFPKGLSQPEMLESIAKGIIGTADYLSPEQARNANAVDIRGDIYSLGCTFYYLLTGEPPFPTGTLMQKILQHQMAEPAPVSTYREDVPAGVIAIIKRMLSKNPDERFQTPAAVAMALYPYAHDRVPSKGTLKLGKKPPTAGAKDETPLPGKLGGVPGRAPTRLPKVGRAPHSHSDTSKPS